MINGIQKEKLISDALEMAERLQYKAVGEEGKSAFSTRLKILFTYPKAKSFLITLLDNSFRSHKNEKVAAYIKKVFSKNEEVYLPLFSWSEKALIDIFTKIGHRFPAISIPLLLTQIKSNSDGVVFLKGTKSFESHLRLRNEKNIQSNINLIGESLLGEGEANERMVQYALLLQDKNINYISIKISTIYSQIHALAYDHTIAVLTERLAELYDELLRIEKETGVTKFVNLDMEEYRDLSMTVDTFIQTLSLPRFKTLKAGIVLQAYVPDSHEWLLKLKEWAADRVNNGGAPIKIRVVKGANMEMEKTESSIHGWPLVTFDKKVYSDANYKKMVLELLNPNSCKSIKLGIASHNVFDIAFAASVVKEYKLQDDVEFELLEGMADTTVVALKKEGFNVLLYTPVVKSEQYTSAIAYLVRRLDEGTADGNFLKEGFELKPVGKKWDALKDEFLQSVDLIYSINSQPRRTQNRLLEKHKLQETGFENEPDTDWVLPQNREWLLTIKERWTNVESPVLTHIPIVGVPAEARETVVQHNWQGALPWKHELATEDDYRLALTLGKQSSWLSFSHQERIAIMRKAAVVMQRRRGDLVGVGVVEVGKLVSELDPEISEAIDFANYYAHSLEEHLKATDYTLEGGEVILVLPPWNFPLAIPAGGIIASLVTGNAVIVKPAPSAVACSFVVCECLWEAGVPKDALFFMPAKETVLAPFLKAEKVFGAVILTGGTNTAKFLLKQNPKLPLYAETGGKNATIVTALSDREQAVAHVVSSAFGNTGQKCSATSLLVLEKEAFEDKVFKQLLIDAISSKKVGSPWEFESQVGPLAVKPNERVMSLLNDTSLEWLMKPEQNGYYLTPGVLWGVTMDDFAYKNELFAPILSVMCADDLTQAIYMVNNTGFGLTSGIQSLDEDEIAYWKANIQAGNLYVNRSTTGAIVQRQPFGGLKQSCFGFGMKAGGENYILQFMKVTPSTSFEEKLKKTTVLKFAENDFNKAYKDHFEKEKPLAALRGQWNSGRYLLPHHKVVVCVGADTEVQDILMVMQAVEAMGLSYEIEVFDTVDFKKELLHHGYEMNERDSWGELKPHLDHNHVFRVLTKNVDAAFQKEAIEQAVHFYTHKPVPFGRIELLNYLTEQSISHNYHRYGNLMGKEELK